MAGQGGIRGAAGVAGLAGPLVDRGQFRARRAAVGSMGLNGSGWAVTAITGSQADGDSISYILTILIQ